MQERNRKPIALFLSMPILAWALYDFANTIFSANIVTLFFPQYITEIVGTNARLEQISSTVIAYANATSAILLIIFSPLFGVLMDRTKKRQKYVVIFTILTVVASILMGFFGGINSGTIFGIPNGLFLTILFFVFAKFTYGSGNVFYDGMLSSLGSKKEVPLISGFGVALGYLGTLVGIFSVLIIVGDAPIHNAFWLSGILFLLFSLPLFFVNKDRVKKQAKTKASFLTGYKEIYQSFKEAKKHPSIFFFMIAYFFINDALATAIAMMQPYATTVVGFESSAFLIVFMVATLFSIIGALVFGFINQKYGSKPTFSIIGIILATAILIAALPLPMWTFWIAASMFGIAMGSVWVVSRTVIIELAPNGHEGQFFGLFAFSAKMSAIVGPFIYGSITLVLSDFGTIASRIAITSLLLMVLVGLYFHSKVKLPTPKV
ncbi:MFS transporter [Jeotgalicoccus sp. ATCC 8456]|uniref:MFS transporter n=1 Tax=Jeotgalicoccus sp. ATCC 8456 TaxID=946435 RepID=UPI0018E5F957|nr:MFS transporter [Jeotgalicoccus sp. ATCC 8456]QQD85851.1 MFS transporter [Jeotgalicoccus sp. ATCC 8456]